jgi:hypothetical protein
LKNGIATGDIDSYIRIGLETNQQFSECSITNTETQEASCTYQFTKETHPQGYKCNGISSVGNAGNNKCQFDILLKDSCKFSHFFQVSFWSSFWSSGIWSSSLLSSNKPHFLTFEMQNIFPKDI